MALRRFYSTSSAKEAAARIAAISTAPAAESSTPRATPLTQGRLKPCGPYSMSERLLAARLSRIDASLSGGGARSSYSTGTAGTKGRRRRLSTTQPSARREGEEEEMEGPEALFTRVQRDRLDGRRQLLPPPADSTLSAMFAEPSMVRHQPVDAFPHETSPSLLGEEFSIHAAFSQLGIGHHLGPYDPPQPPQSETKRSFSWEIPFEAAHRRRNAPVDSTMMWWAPTPVDQASQPAQYIAKMQETTETVGALVNKLEKERKQQAEAQTEMMEWAAHEAEATWIQMDSVQRKRRKMIKKMKYKKRRKAQRALRRKLAR